MAAIAAVFKNVKEFKTIKTVHKPGQNLALADSIAYGEAWRYFWIPPDIGELIDIHEHDDSEEDVANLAEEFTEKDGEFAHIKGFRLIHGAAKYFWTISKEIADSFNHSPGAHVGWHSWLIGKLKVMEAKGFSKEADHDPV